MTSTRSTSLMKLIHVFLKIAHPPLPLLTPFPLLSSPMLDNIHNHIDTDVSTSFKLDKKGNNLKDLTSTSPTLYFAGAHCRCWDYIRTMYGIIN